MNRNEEGDRGLVIAITGGIGCGKSEVGRVLESFGWQVLDTDYTGHALLKKGTAVYEQVVEHFGPHILGPDGEVNRYALGEVVFSNESQLETLNSLLHPAIKNSWQEWVEAQRRKKKNAAVLIPLLFEVGETRGWDAIVCVCAPLDIVMKRLLTRGMVESEIEKRIQAQMPLEEKRERSDFEIMNDKSLDALKREVEQVLVSIQKETA